jgi:acyl-CoA synthetase (AMP-forming)/AMP-acid ligase II
VERNRTADTTDPAAPRTWSEMVARRVGASDAAVIHPDGAWWNLDELLARAAGAADWLDTINAEPGVPVPALVSSTIPAFALLFAGAGSGRPLAPLSARFVLDDLVACVVGVGAGVVVAQPEALAVADAVAARTGTRVAVVPEEFTPSRRLLDMDPNPHDVVVVIHTSGTTGRPKAVYQTQGPMVDRVARSAGPIELGPGCRYATASAFHHQAGAGLFIVAMGAGATLVPLAHFSPDTWKALEPLRPTHATVVPALMEALLDAGVLDLPSLRFVQYGSSPMHADTVGRLVAEYPGINLVQQFGQTEGSPITTFDHAMHLEALAHAPHRLRSVGLPIVGTELRIEDEDPDGVGEICSRASHYFVPDPDGWLRTGDLGYTDDDAFVYIVGRQHDVINRGGDKIYPVEVEQVLARHPDVAEVAVVGAPDRRLGQVPHAFVVPAPETAPRSDELEAFARERLTRFKVPRHWHFVDELPRNPANKVLRRLLVPPDAAT